MKINMKRIMVLSAILILCISQHVTYGDPPGMPVEDHGGSGNQVPAPIDGGFGFILLMAAGYGITKIRKAGKEKRE